MTDPGSVSAVIFGCAGPALTPWERSFLADVKPLGFILFQRNIESPDQVRALTSSLRDLVEREDAPILIDQEGGRVRRLRPPHWREVRAPADFGTLAGDDGPGALRAVFVNHRLIAAEIASLGIDVDCAPLVDLRFPNAHEVIGDRAFSGEAELVARLGRAAARGLMAGGVTPVVKHMPGHGRALADSHFELPRIKASLSELRATDFVPFVELADLPWAMTAHVVYEAIDRDRPASLSPKVIGDVIRKEFGFDGLLVCDDLSMKALAGDLRTLVKDSLAAGCDVVLHCNGKPEEMRAVAEGVSRLSEQANRRFRRGRAMVGLANQCNVAELSEELARHFG